MNVQATLGPLFAHLGRPLKGDDSPATVWDWDSLRQVDVILAIEEDCGISLTTAEIAGMTSIGAIAEILRTRGIDVQLSSTSPRTA